MVTITAVSSRYKIPFRIARCIAVCILVKKRIPVTIVVLKSVGARPCGVTCAGTLTIINVNAYPNAFNFFFRFTKSTVDATKVSFNCNRRRFVRRLPGTAHNETALYPVTSSSNYRFPSARFSVTNSPRDFYFICRRTNDFRRLWCSIFN